MVPAPDGAVGQGDRQAVALLYSGILAVSGIVAGPYVVADMGVYQPGTQGKRQRMNVVPVGAVDRHVYRPGDLDREVRT